MKKQELITLLRSVTAQDLRKAVVLKEKMDKLEAKREALQRELGGVMDALAAIRGQVEQRAGGAAAGRPRAATRTRRGARPSLSALIVEILQEKKRGLKINEICDALLEEKHYKTRAKNFKGQIRVLLYRNEKGLFKKAGPGLFELSGKAQAAPETAKATTGRATRKAVVRKKKRTVKKRSPKAKAARKKAARKKAAKKKTPKVKAVRRKAAKKKTATKKAAKKKAAKKKAATKKA